MTEQGRWPSATDYIDAVQYPALVFSHGELKEARFDLDMYGIPDGCTGSNAIVFRAMLGPRTVALRCFTSQAGLSRERYLALGRHVDADERGAALVVPDYRSPATASEVDDHVSGRRLQEAPQHPLPDARLQQRRRHGLVACVAMERLVEVLRLLGERR